MIPAEYVQLEANIRESKDAPRGTVVVCHPHPVYGGTMDESCSLESLARFERRLPPASSLSRVEGADHFFSGCVESAESLIVGFLRGLSTDRWIS